jgi:hypothetical protein
VAAGRRWTEALLNQQGCACLACRVVGEDECAARTRLLNDACGSYGLPGMAEPGRAVGWSTQDTFQAPLLKEPLDDGGSWRPAGHVARSNPPADPEPSQPPEPSSVATINGIRERA